MTREVLIWLTRVTQDGLCFGAASFMADSTVVYLGKGERVKPRGTQEKAVRSLLLKGCGAAEPG